MKTVVILVDNKRRDLPGAALIAHHLQKINVRCELEPLGAWRSVLWAHKPDMIIFNHLTASHLEKYSMELHKRGILVAVLPSEGILYVQEELEYNAAKFHNNSHMDHFFSWNTVLADELRKVWNNTVSQVHVIGIPRFDFYFPPLAKQFQPSPRKKVLICTNFVFSKFHNMDSAISERFFERWSEAIPAYKNWQEIVKINHDCSLHIFDFLNALIHQTSHEIILRPHPSEEEDLYEKWCNSLDKELRKRVRYDRKSNVSDLILECDLEVACDTCTTSMEAWIAGKPTIDIHLTDHPIFHHSFTETLTSVCTKPDQFPKMVEDLLENGEPEQFAEPRRKHLQKWCNSPDGHMCEHFSALLKNIVDIHPTPDFSRLSFSDIRRGIRLKLLKALGKPCTYKPLLSLKYALRPKKYARKYQGYEKTIRPADVRDWLEKFEKLGI